MNKDMYVSKKDKEKVVGPISRIAFVMVEPVTIGQEMENRRLKPYLQKGKYDEGLMNNKGKQKRRRMDKVKRRKRMMPMELGRIARRREKQFVNFSKGQQTQRLMRLVTMFSLEVVFV
ncbi:unnamed protein product [Dovyalis caffra]|uniref:Uncharacterized protein n=1 Tax=Dovyalis caffra TaxID=77055 RepID=A0AAV1SQD7_9ROSI|nr:unnamed protein product [Dovyalis caffra]